MYSFFLFIIFSFKCFSKKLSIQDSWSIIGFLGPIWDGCEFMIFGLQIQFSKQNVFGKNEIEWVFNSILK